MTSLVEILTKAAQGTASDLTGAMQDTAALAGWDPKVASNTSVKFTGSTFAVDVHPKYEERAKAHEYGSQTSSPTSVMRKFSNNDADAADMLAGKFLEEVDMTL